MDFYSRFKMRSFLTALGFLLSSVGFGQSIQTLDSLIEAGSPVKSLEIISDRISAIENSQDQALLPEYLGVFGRAHLALSDESQANRQVESKLSSWGKLLNKPKDLKNLWLAAAIWYEYIGQLENAYQAGFKSVEFARNEPGITSKELGKLLLYLGAYAVNRLDLTAAKIHLKEAQTLLEKDPDPESIYQLNSFLGDIAYYASQMDSAEYFLKKCLQAFETMEPSLRNSHYRPAIVLNSLSGVQSALGKTTEAIQSMNETVAHLKTFKDNEKEPIEQKKGKVFYFQAIDNLGGIYRGLGNFRKAQDLLEYSYAKKQEFFGPNSKDVWLSQILLGQLYFEQEESEKARKILAQGLNGFKQTAGSHILYEADGWYTLGMIEDAAQNEALALENYQRADSLFQQGLQGEFDVIYLEFLKNYGLFLAEIGMDTQAIRQVQQAYEYVLENQGEKSLMAFQQELSVGEVFFELRRYTEATIWSEKALETLKTQFSGSQSLLDSLKIERNKPQAILLSAKSRYENRQDKDPNFLKSLLAEMESGLDALDRRKFFLESDEDISLMIQDNQAFFQFVEELNLQLYQKTKDKQYLAKLLSMHESALYQRIRARLEQADPTRFGSIPADFFKKEQEIKSQLRASIQDSENGVEQYIKASKAWEDFLAQARRDYPEYVEFRYASIQRDFDLITRQLPESTAVVRYLIVGKDLFGVVLGKSDPQLVQLDFPTAEKILKTFQSDWDDEEKTRTNLHQLYLALWAPLEGAIQTERVLVVPDGILFNLNFEILTPKKLSSYSDLASGSLLTKHSFSYHYSTLLFSYPIQKQAYRSNFSAFAPGFSDEMKKSYLNEISDSLKIDQSYLTLIPQPFTDRLVSTLKGLFGGKVYTKEASTLDQFNKEAGNHRILHIGTHAESNNTSPDFSRLIFAKVNGRPEEENSLYAKDIYQLDMRSELAVLMACETGKPTFAPGEGMISLAHAFNYAGSKSLLTGIWKIDEKASTQIAESFYQYLSEGKTKDKALQLAKLDYLKTAEGRALSPEFWAGLIVMGDGSPVSFDPVFGHWGWIALGMLVLVICLVFLFRKKETAVK